MGLCSLEYGSEFPDELLLKRRDGSELDRCLQQAYSSQLRRFSWTGSFWLQALLWALGIHPMLTQILNLCLTYLHLLKC